MGVAFVMIKRYKFSGRIIFVTSPSGTRTLNPRNFTKILFSFSLARGSELANMFVDLRLSR